MAWGPGERAAFDEKEARVKDGVRMAVTSIRDYRNGPIDETKDMIVGPEVVALTIGMPKDAVKGLLLSALLILAMETDWARE